MKIALVLDRWDRRGGGLELWAKDLVAGLSARGYDMHVAAFEFRSPVDGATPHLLPPRQGKVARGEAAAELLRGIAADIVHDTGVGWRCDVLHPQVGSKMANHRRDLDSRPPLARWVGSIRPGRWRWQRDVRELERRQYQQPGGTIVVPSKLVADDLRTLYGVAEQRFRLVPNGVDTERFSPERRIARRAEARRQFGFGHETVFLFSAMNPRLKGALPALRAMSRLRGCRLLMIGGEPPSEYRRVEGTLFGGYFEDPLLPLAAADAFVLPTYHDACSLTVLEAWATGLPVVTTRFNGASELMKNGVEGFRIDDPADDAALAEAMKRLDDPRLREWMSRAARALALDNSLERHLDRIEDVYRSLR